MKLFGAILRTPVKQWKTGKINPGLKSEERDGLLRWAYNSPEIRQILAGDLLLYDLAVSIFKRQLVESEVND